MAEMMEHLDIHFLNVGHGDCTVIAFPSGHLTMIDVNNSQTLTDDEELGLALEKGLTLETFKKAAAGMVSWEQYYQSLLVDPADYFKKWFPGKGLFRYIQTHPELDHMSGLCRLFWEEKINLLNFWDTNNTRICEKTDFENSRYDWNDWLVYQRMKSAHVQDGNEHKVFHNLRGESGQFWTDDGITILAPTQGLTDDANASVDWNALSYVLRVDYGGRAVILAGDAGQPTWDSIEDGVRASVLSCDILKAAHHGRLSGYSESATNLMDPALVICSVGKKPATDATAKYKSHSAEVLSTRYCGTILVRIFEDGEVRVYNSSLEDVFTLPELT
jgi:beta-lactamase superfamily II metal-dependent hydrolase